MEEQAQNQGQDQGQDQMMQQIAQTVQQMVDQGMQPADIAGQLLQQVPPDQLMQIFVELGLPQDQAQQAIEQAMQAGQQGAPQEQGAPVDPNQQQVSADPNQQMSPEDMTAQEQQAGAEQPMMMFGGSMRRLMKKSFGGSTPLDETSQNYPAERLAMFVNTVKKNTMMSALDQSLPSFSNSLPKAVEGVEIRGKSGTTTTNFKTPDQFEKHISGLLSNGEIDKAEYDRLTGTDVSSGTKPTVIKTGSSVTQSQYDPNVSYRWDPTQGKMVPNQNNWNYNQGQQGNYPVGYGFNNQPNVAPMFRIFGNQQGYGNPRIRSNNLPQGTDAYEFMRNAFSQGPAGTFNNQNYRITDVENIKGGIFGRKKVGTRYHIDWGNGASPTTATSTGPGYSGYNADSNGDGIPDYLSNNNSTQAIDKNVQTISPTYATVQNKNEQLPFYPTLDGSPITPNITPIDISTGINTGQTNTVANQDVVNNTQQTGTTTSTNTGTQSNEVNTNTTPFSSSFERLYPDWDISKDWNVQGQALRAAKLQQLKDGKFADGTEAVYDEKYGQFVPVKAFGGNLPRAEFGLDIALSDNTTTMEQYNSDPAIKQKIDAYLAMLNQNSAASQSTVDMKNKNRLNVDWGAVGDTVMNTGNRYANFMDKVRGYNPERENAMYSSMNRQSRTFDQMDQGLYQPDGQLFPNQLGSQVLNNTDTYGVQQMPAFAMGGEYDLSDDELNQLAQVGFKFKRM